MIETTFSWESFTAVGDGSFSPLLVHSSFQSPIRGVQKLVKVFFSGTEPSSFFSPTREFTTPPDLQVGWRFGYPYSGAILHPNGTNARTVFDDAESKLLSCRSWRPWRLDTSKSWRTCTPNRKQSTWRALSRTQRWRHDNRKQDQQHGGRADAVQRQSLSFVVLATGDVTRDVIDPDRHEARGELHLVAELAVPYHTVLHRLSAARSSKSQRHLSGLMHAIFLVYL